MAVKNREDFSEMILMGKQYRDAIQQKANDAAAKRAAEIYRENAYDISDLNKFAYQGGGNMSLFSSDFSFLGRISPYFKSYNITQIGKKSGNMSNIINNTDNFCSEFKQVEAACHATVREFEKFCDENNIKVKISNNCSQPDRIYGNWLPFASFTI